MLTLVSTMSTQTTDFSPTVLKGTFACDGSYVHKALPSIFGFVCVLFVINAQYSRGKPRSSPEISYQSLDQSDISPQMTPRGLLPLLPLHRSSASTTSGTFGCSESSLYPAIGELATPEEDPVQFPANDPIPMHASTSAIAHSSRQICKGR